MDEMERLKRVRTRLLIHHPFFGYVASKLSLELDERVPTACTDCRSKVSFNPKFVGELPISQLLTLLAHEVGHPLLLFPERVGSRNKVVFNAAQDYAWNIILKDSGFEPISTKEFSWLCDERFRGKTAEQIYDEIYKDIPGDGYPGQDVNCGDGSSLGRPDGLGSSGTPINWKRVMAEAASFAKMRGRLPSAIEEMVGEIIHPKVRWQDVIRSAISSAKRNDWSYRRPNRRYAHEGIIMPVPFGYKSSVEVWIDSSGSISKEWFELGLGVCVECAKELKVPLNVGVCDAKVQLFERNVRDTDILRRVKFRGRGGTNFSPAFDHVREGRRRPDALIYFTDLQGSFPKAKPSYQVLWCVPESAKGHVRDVPFGRILYVSDGRKHGSS